MRTLKKILPGLCYMLAGMLFLWLPTQFEVALERIAGVLCLASSLIFLWKAIKRKRAVELIAFAADVLFGLAFLFSGPYFFTALYSLYLAGIGVIYLIQWGLDHFAWQEGIPGFLYLAAGVGFLLVPRATGVVFGSYLLIQALQNWIEDFCFSSSYNARYWAIRDWVSLPCFIVGILPAFLVAELQDRHMKNQPIHYDEHKNDLPVNLRIFIHSGTRGRTLYGHMTFSYNEMMYSYGDYDVAAEKFFETIGPGIFFTVNGPLYSNNCCVIENSPLFEYGLHLSEEQIKKIAPMTEEIMNNTTPWQCRLEKEPEADWPKDFPKFESTYADRLWYRTRCKYRMYEKGRWHWYTLLGNNCSNWASAKLNELGLNLPVQKSVVSPGEYYEVFEELFKDPDSCVVYRSWHDAKDPKTLYTIDGMLGYAGVGTGAVSVKKAK